MKKAKSKKRITEYTNLNTHLDLYDTYEINEFIERIQRKISLLKDAGAIDDTIKIDLIGGAGCCDSGAELELSYERYETDKETASRLRREKKERQKRAKSKQDKKTKEYKRYLELKKQFGE